MHSNFSSRFDAAYNYRLYLRTKGYLEDDRGWEPQDPTDLEAESVERDQEGLGEVEEF